MAASKRAGGGDVVPVPGGFVVRHRVPNGTTDTVAPGVDGSSKVQGNQPTPGMGAGTSPVDGLAADKGSSPAANLVSPVGLPAKVSDEAVKKVSSPRLSVVGEAQVAIDQAATGQVAQEQPEASVQIQTAKKKSPNQRIAENLQARADYFTPGNIVQSYSGHDRVISYKAPDGKGDGWNVTVQAVVKQDGQWVVDPKDKRIRTHSTQPEKADLARGPIDKAPQKPVAVQVAPKEISRGGAGEDAPPAGGSQPIDLPSRSAVTQSEVTQAEAQARQAIQDAIDAMAGPAAQQLAKRFLPTMGVKVPIGKERIKAAMVDAKVNLQAAASEAGISLPESVNAALTAKAEGRIGRAETAQGKPEATPDKLTIKSVTTTDTTANGVEDDTARLQSDTEIATQPDGESNPVSQGPAKPAAKIDDFGEKLAGARKDYAALMKDAESVDISAEPLSKSWPEPDYQKLVDSGVPKRTVALVRSMRDEVPTKPQKGWKLKTWVEQVALLRGMTNSILSGDISKESLDAKLNSAEYKNLQENIGGRADLYEAVGHEKSLKGVTFKQHLYSLYKNERNVIKWSIEQKSKATAFGNWPKEIVVTDSREKTLAEFVTKYDSLDLGKSKAKPSFIIYRKRGQEGAFVGKKIGREYIDLHKAADIKAARAYLEGNADALEALLAKYKDTPYERNEENAPRVGGDHRNGAPVTPEVFAETFGFRGVQFGNYVEQGRRQSDLNEAFDALMDMAAVLGVSPRAISLNGRLGLAFGARGKGGKNAPAAHYEGGNMVINLTKGGGPGSLAHEWFHAMDNYFALADGGEGGYITGGAVSDKLRMKMRAAFAAIKRAVLAGDLKLRSEELDKRRSKPYWATPIEMAARSFESYIIAKLQDQNASNDYLANIVSQQAWDVSDAMRLGDFSDKGPASSYPYPTVDEIPAIRAAFDEFFKTVETKETDKGVAMFSRRSASGNHLPNVVIGHKLGALSTHPDYAAAKAGDTEAALRLAIEMVDDAMIEEVMDASNGADVIVPVVSVEASGRNKIPLAVAEVLADRLGTTAESQIVQADSPRRTAMDGLSRLLTPPVFDGPVQKGVAYVLVDDTVTQGGTFASLASHIRDNGGEVTAVVALTGKEYSAKLELSPELLNQVRERFQSVEDKFKAATGYGFDALTESEARYLAKHDDAQSVRNRIIEAGNAASLRENAGNARFSKDAKAGRAGLTSSQVRSISDTIKARWANAPEVVVVENMDDPAVPKRVRDEDADQQSKGATGEPEGFFDAGKVYIVASAMNKPGDVIRVLFHEALGHAGLRGVFGDGLKPILQQLSVLRKPDIVAKARAYGLVGKGIDVETSTDKDVFASMSPEQRLTAAEEVLAELAQKHPEIGYVRRAIAAIRAFLRRNVPGFMEMKMSDSEIISQMIIPARRFIEGKGGPKGGKKALQIGTSSSQLAFDRGTSSNQDETGTEALFSRSPIGQVAQSTQDALKNATVTDLLKQFGNRLSDFRGLGLQLLGRRQLVDIYAKDIPMLDAYSNMVAQMDADKNEAGADADKLVTDWANLKDERQLAELMHDATLGQIDPSKPFVEGDDENFYEALKDGYDRLSPEAKGIYARAREMYTEHHEKVRSGIKDRIDSSALSSAKRQALLKKMDGELFKKTKGVYFPLSRFGQYLTIVKDSTGEVRNVTRSETMNEAEEVRRLLKRNYPASGGFQVGKVLKAREFNAVRDGVGRGFMEDLFQTLEKTGASEELQESISQLYLASMPDLSWSKHGIHRKGTPGFSQDARRAFAQNMFHGGNYLAKLRYADKLQSSLDDMQEHVDGQKDNDAYDSVKAQQVVDEMVKRHESMMNPKSSPISTALTSFGFVFHLGLSPASALVNLSQTALVAYPIMGAKWGYAKASAALLEASRQAAGNKNDISKTLSGRELDAYNEAVRSGVIDVTMAHDLAGISQGEDAKLSAKIRPVMKWASFMFHHAEKFNRQVTFVASYRLAIEGGSTHDAAYADAVKATYDGHFDYSASNRARIMQGNWQKVILLFKQYAQNMIYTLGRNLQQAIQAETPEGRKEARKAITGLLVSHALAAGVFGLPMVGMLLGAASMIGSDDDEPWDAKVALQNMLADSFGQKASEVFAHGLSRLTPWDISGRVGLDKLLLPDIQEGLQGASAAQAWLASAAGPVAGIMVNAIKGLSEISGGDYQRGLESMMPTALRGPLKAYRYETEGNIDKSGVAINDEVGVAGVVGQALGFSPSETRLAQEGKSAIYSADKAIQNRRSSLVRQFSLASMASDSEGMADTRRDIVRFNQKNPNARITQSHLVSSVKARQKRINQAKMGVYLPSKRKDSLAAGRFAEVE